MKDVALFDAKNRLSALVQEVIDTGEDIVITRHGQPAVRLTRVTSRPSGQEWQAAMAELDRLNADFVKRHPLAGERIAWETLKAQLDDKPA
jgi:prevent-host-death family protein